MGATEPLHPQKSWSFIGPRRHDHQRRYNGTPTGFPNDCEDGSGLTHWYVLHAEANAIMKVARSTNNANGATLYLTHSPCRECSKLILQAGIRRLVYVDPYKDATGLDLLKNGGVMVHRLEKA